MLIPHIMPVWIRFYPFPPPSLPPSLPPYLTNRAHSAMGVVVLDDAAALGAALVVLQHIGVHNVAHLGKGREGGREGGREE